MSPLEPLPPVKRCVHMLACGLRHARIFEATDAVMAELVPAILATPLGNAGKLWGEPQRQWLVSSRKALVFARGGARHATRIHAAAEDIAMFWRRWSG